MVLRRLQTSARARGITLDIGQFPETDLDADVSDPTRPVRITAHAVARVADRLPFSRRLSRHMEGTENRAGIVSDLLSLLTELVRRNPDLVENRLESFGDDLQRARAMRAAKQQSQSASMEGNNNAA